MSVLPSHKWGSGPRSLEGPDQAQQAFAAFRSRHAAEYNEREEILRQMQRLFIPRHKDLTRRSEA